MSPDRHGAGRAGEGHLDSVRACEADQAYMLAIMIGVKEFHDILHLLLGVSLIIHGHKHGRQVVHVAFPICSPPKSGLTVQY